jgi:outer membrane protein assembly factor BamB
MGLLSSEQTSCCRHDRNHPKMHVSVCLFFIVHLASLGAGQNHSATATNGPLFPTFTLSSPLCAKTLENSTVVVSDSMGNVLASGHGVLCKYKPDGRLDWARHFGNPHTLGEASMSPRLAIGELVSEGQSLRVPGARGSHAVFVTSDDGLYAIDVATGSTLWYYYCGAIRSTPLVVQTARCNATEQKSTEPIRPCSRHTILFGAEDETYHALDFNGTRLWTVNFGGWFGTKYYGWPLRFAASFGGNRFFIMTYRGLAALDVDGKFAWSYAQAPPAVANRGTWSAAIQAKINSLGPVFSNEMIAYSSGEAVNVISSHGKLLGRFMILKPGSSLGEPPLVDFTTTPTWFGSKILVGDSNSTLYCLKVIGEGRHTAVQWRYHFSQSPDAASSSIRRRRKLMAAELAHVSNVTSNSTNTTDQMAKTNFSPHNSTNMTDSSNDEPIMANSFEPTPVQLQPIWDKPIVSKNGLVYARGPTGLHALDAITGKALWVYSAQPLETDGQLLADFTEVKTDAVSGINFNRMHVRHSRLAATVCGGLGKPDCQAAVSIPDRRSFPDTRNCNVPNISNTTAPNSSDCSSKTHMLPAKIIECGGKLSHGEGHLAMDGSLVFPCRGVLHRVCCAPCLASVIGNNAAYSGENISVLLEGALTPRELTTRLSCLWYDTRNTTGTRLISTAASYGNTSGNVSEAQLVVCNVPGPEESLPQIYLPLRILQQDAAGFLHFCDGERAGIHIKVPVPEPPLSYLMYYILGSAVVITILLFQLSRVLYASYRRQTEYAMIEGEFTKIGLGGLKHEHYLRLLKLLQKWHSRHLPNIFNDWRWAVRLTQLQRRLRLTEEQKIW